MGFSSRTSKQSTKPIYEQEIKQSYSNLNNAYNAQAPKLSGITDRLDGLTPNLFAQYQAGDPGVNAARGYNTDVLSGKYLNGSPQLDALVRMTGDNTRNGVSASLGTRGLTGGSDFAGIIARELAKNETGLRYSDYATERARMDGAASLAPELAAAQYQPLDAIMQIAQAQTMPSQLATGNAAATGGLLGQYTKQKLTQNQSVMDGIGQAVNIAAAIAGFPTPKKG